MIKKNFKKKPRRSYPTVAVIKKATLEQLEEWLDTLTYPGHGLSPAKMPKTYAVVKASEAARRKLIQDRIASLKNKKKGGKN